MRATRFTPVRSSLIARKRATRVQANPDSQAAHVLPGIALKRTLHLDSGHSGVERSLEDRTYGVADGLEDCAAMSIDDFCKQRIMARQHSIHRGAKFVPRRVLPSISVKTNVTVPLGSDMCVMTPCGGPGGRGP